MHLRICILIIILVTKCNTNLHPLFFVSKCKSVTGLVLVVRGFERPEHEEMKHLAVNRSVGVHISSCSGLSNPCTPRTHPVSNSYRMSARGAWIGTTSARGNVNCKRRQPRGVYIPRAEVVPIHAPRARFR